MDDIIQCFFKNVYTFLKICDKIKGCNFYANEIPATSQASKQLRSRACRCIYTINIVSRDQELTTCDFLLCTPKACTTSYWLDIQEEVSGKTTTILAT